MKNEGLSARVTITMTPDELAIIDEWMFRERKRSRSEAIRELIARGLAAEPEPEKPTKKRAR